MVYRGIVKNGVVVFEKGAKPADGLEVRVEPVLPAEMVSAERRTLAEQLGDVIGTVRDLPPDMACATRSLPPRGSQAMKRVFADTLYCSQNRHARIEYTSRKGDTYILQAGQTRTGKPALVVGRKLTGTPVEVLPAGYEIYESPGGGQVSCARSSTRRLAPRSASWLRRACADMPAWSTLPSISKATPWWFTCPTRTARRSIVCRRGGAHWLSRPCAR